MITSLNLYLMGVKLNNNFDYINRVNVGILEEVYDSEDFLETLAI